MNYRYRYIGSTQICIQKIGKILPKLGEIYQVTGKRWNGKYGVNEAVFVKGTKGTARFGGFLWGYYGEGPRGLITLLKYLGFTEEFAVTFAYETPRQSTIGVDWSLPAKFNCTIN